MVELLLEAVGASVATPSTGGIMFPPTLIDSSTPKFHLGQAYQGARSHWDRDRYDERLDATVLAPAGKTPPIGLSLLPISIKGPSP